MAIKYQHNKMAMQQLQKELKIRENALPILTAKETALRLEVLKAREEVSGIVGLLLEKRRQVSETYRLWKEFPKDIISIAEVKSGIKKIAGVKIPVFDKIIFNETNYSLFNSPAWIPAGIEIIKALTELEIKREIALKKVLVLENARKKTTQKVNLYEKVQIPEYREAILKIKRFLEDEDNLSKSAQKILKARLALTEVSA